MELSLNKTSDPISEHKLNTNNDMLKSYDQFNEVKTSLMSGLNLIKNFLLSETLVIKSPLIKKINDFILSFDKENKLEILISKLISLVIKLISLGSRIEKESKTISLEFMSTILKLAKLISDLSDVPEEAFKAAKDKLSDGEKRVGSLRSELTLGLKMLMIELNSFTLKTEATGRLIGELSLLQVKLNIEDYSDSDSDSDSVYYPKTQLKRSKIMISSLKSFVSELESFVLTGKDNKYSSGSLKLLFLSCIKLEESVLKLIEELENNPDAIKLIEEYNSEQLKKLNHFILQKDDDSSEDDDDSSEDDDSSQDDDSLNLDDELDTTITLKKKVTTQIKLVREEITLGIESFEFEKQEDLKGLCLKSDSIIRELEIDFFTKKLEADLISLNKELKSSFGDNSEMINLLDLPSLIPDMVQDVAKFNYKYTFLCKDIKLSLVKILLRLSLLKLELRKKVKLDKDMESLLLRMANGIELLVMRAESSAGKPNLMNLEFTESVECLKMKLPPLKFLNKYAKLKEIYALEESISDLISLVPVLRSLVELDQKQDEKILDDYNLAVMEIRLKELSKDVDFASQDVSFHCQDASSHREDASSHQEDVSSHREDFPCLRGIHYCDYEKTKSIMSLNETIKFLKVKLYSELYSELRIKLKREGGITDNTSKDVLKEVIRRIDSSQSKLQLKSGYEEIKESKKILTDMKKELKPWIDLDSYKFASSSATDSALDMISLLLKRSDKKDASLHRQDAPLHRQDASLHRQDVPSHQEDVNSLQRCFIRRQDASLHREDSSSHQEDVNSLQRCFLRRQDASLHREDSSSHQEDVPSHQEDVNSLQRCFLHRQYPPLHRQYPPLRRQDVSLQDSSLSGNDELIDWEIIQKKESSQEPHSVQTNKVVWVNDKKTKRLLRRLTSKLVWFQIESSVNLKSYDPVILTLIMTLNLFMDEIMPEVGHILTEEKRREPEILVLTLNNRLDSLASVDKFKFTIPPSKLIDMLLGLEYEFNLLNINPIVHSKEFSDDMDMSLEEKKSKIISMLEYLGEKIIYLEELREEFIEKLLLIIDTDFSSMISEIKNYELLEFIEASRELGVMKKLKDTCRNECQKAMKRSKKSELSQLSELLILISGPTKLLSTLVAERFFSDIS